MDLNFSLIFISFSFLIIPMNKILFQTWGTKRRTLKTYSLQKTENYLMPTLRINHSNRTIFHTEILIFLDTKLNYTVVAIPIPWKNRKYIFKLCLIYLTHTHAPPDTIKIFITHIFMKTYCKFISISIFLRFSSIKKKWRKSHLSQQAKQNKK